MNTHRWVWSRFELADPGDRFGTAQSVRHLLPITDHPTSDQDCRDRDKGERERENQGIILRDPIGTMPNEWVEAEQLSSDIFLPAAGDCLSLRL